MFPSLVCKFVAWHLVMLSQVKEKDLANFNVGSYQNMEWHFMKWYIFSNNFQANTSYPVYFGIIYCTYNQSIY